MSENINIESLEKQDEANNVNEELKALAKEIELREILLESIVSQLGSDPEKRSFRVRSFIQQLSFDNDMIPRYPDELDGSIMDPKRRSVEITRWIDGGMQNWKNKVANNKEKTGLEDGIFEKLKHYIFEYMQSSGKRRIFRTLLELSRFSHHESIPLKSRARQMIMNDCLLGLSVVRRAHREPVLPLNSDRIDPSKLFLRTWKRAARRMLIGSLPRKLKTMREESSHG